jgi:hypothetical protein
VTLDGRVIYSPNAQTNWAGRGNTGYIARLDLAADRVRVYFPNRLKRLATVGLPDEVEIPISTVTGVERLLFRGVMLRTNDRKSDGTCFIPRGSTQTLITALEAHDVRFIPSSKWRRFALALAHFAAAIQLGATLGRRVL